MQEIIWGKGDTEDMGNTHYVLSSTLSLHGSRGPGTVHSIKNNTGKEVVSSCLWLFNHSECFPFLFSPSHSSSLILS